LFSVKEMIAIKIEKDDTTRRESVGRRTRAKNERVLRAIILARKHIKDDNEFATMVNTILVAERMVTMDEFGILER
jgi:hypothetical protein